jgi:hypothetical protein
VLSGSGGGGGPGRGGCQWCHRRARRPAATERQQQFNNSLSLLINEQNKAPRSAVQQFNSSTIQQFNNSLSLLINEIKRGLAVDWVSWRARQ